MNGAGRKMDAGFLEMETDFSLDSFVVNDVLLGRG